MKCPSEKSVLRLNPYKRQKQVFSSSQSTHVDDASLETYTDCSCSSIILFLTTTNIRLSLFLTWPKDLVTLLSVITSVYWLLTKISPLFEGLVLKCHVLCRYWIKKMMNQENEWRDQRDQSSDVGCCCWGSKKRLTITRMLLWSLSSRFCQTKQRKSEGRWSCFVLLSLSLFTRKTRKRKTSLSASAPTASCVEWGGEREGGRREQKSVRWRRRLPLVVGMEGQVLYDSLESNNSCQSLTSSSYQSLYSLLFTLDVEASLFQDRTCFDPWAEKGRPREKITSLSQQYSLLLGEGKDSLNSLLLSKDCSSSSEEERSWSSSSLIALLSSAALL